MTAKNMVKCAFLFVMLMASSLTYAQQQMPRTPEERAQKQLNWMQKNLGLTDDQGKKAYAILLSAAIQADKVKGEQPGQDKRMDRDDVMKTRDSNMQQVLTGDQYQRYLAHEQELRDKMQQRRAMQQGRN